MSEIDLDLARLIRERAYDRWKERGGGEGDADADWLEAEREIKTLDRTVENELKKETTTENSATPLPDSGQPT